MIAPKVLISWLVVGVVLCGCSEKQKEAARLEAAMKNGDSVIVPEHAGSSDTIVRGQFDSAVAEISAQAVLVTPQTTGDSQAIEGAADSNLSGPDMQTSESSPAGSTVDSNSSVSIEQVMDAGAIPQEEVPKGKDTSPAVTPSQGQAESTVGFVVQVASTPDASEAAGLVAKFTKGGYPAFTMKVEVDGATYHRVRIGRYTTVAEAEAALLELHDKFKVNGFVASVR